MQKMEAEQTYRYGSKVYVDPSTWAWGKPDPSGFPQHVRLNLPCNTSNVTDLQTRLLALGSYARRVTRLQDKAKELNNPGNHTSDYDLEAVLKNNTMAQFGYSTHGDTWLNHA